MRNLARKLTLNLTCQLMLMYAMHMQCSCNYVHTIAYNFVVHTIMHTTLTAQTRSSYRYKCMYIYHIFAYRVNARSAHYAHYTHCTHFTQYVLCKLRILLLFFRIMLLNRIKHIMCIMHYAYYVHYTHYVHYVNTTWIQGTRMQCSLNLHATMHIQLHTTFTCIQPCIKHWLRIQDLHTVTIYVPAKSTQDLPILRITSIKTITCIMHIMRYALYVHYAFHIWCAYNVHTTMLIELHATLTYIQLREYNFDAHTVVRTTLTVHTGSS